MCSTSIIFTAVKEPPTPDFTRGARACTRRIRVGFRASGEAEVVCSLAPTPIDYVHLEVHHTLSRRPTRFQPRERTISPRLKAVDLMTKSSNSYRQVEQFQTEGSTRKGTIWCNKGSANYAVKISNSSRCHPRSRAASTRLGMCSKHLHQHQCFIVSPPVVCLQPQDLNDLNIIIL